MSNETTTEFWTSENPFDVAQIITKRILYAFYLWLFRFSGASVILIFLTFIIGSVAMVILSILMSRINRELNRKYGFWTDREHLEGSLKKKEKDFKAKLKRRNAKREKKLRRQVKFSIKK